MTDDYKTRVNLKLTQLTHKLLKVWCAEMGLTIQRGATRMIEEGVKRKVGGAAAQGLVELAPGTWGPAPVARDPAPSAPPVAEPITLSLVVVPDEQAARGSAEREAWEFEEYSAGLIDEVTLEQFRVLRDGYARKVGWDAPNNPLAITSADIARILAETEAFELPKEEDPPPAKQQHIELATSYTVTSHEVTIERGAPEEKDSDAELADINQRAQAGGPLLANEVERLPANWTTLDGLTRAEYVERFGDDDGIKYYRPVAAAKMDVDAPLDLTAVGK